MCENQPKTPKMPKKRGLLAKIPYKREILILKNHQRKSLRAKGDFLELGHFQNRQFGIKSPRLVTLAIITFLAGFL